MSVKKFLNHWEEKNVSMVYDWHREVLDKSAENANS